MKERRPNSSSQPKELRTPIIWTGPKPLVKGLLGGEPSEADKTKNRLLRDDAWKRAVEESFAKLEVLAAHEGVSTSYTGWEASLCLRLAVKLYKGFEIKFEKSNRGRRKEWDFERYLCLIGDVEAFKREQVNKGRIRPTDVAACGHLVRGCQRLGKGKYLPMKAETTEAAIATLQNRLSDARNHWFFAPLKRSKDPDTVEAMHGAIIKLSGHPGN